jgi:transposase
MNKSRTAIKMLLYDGQGFWLFQKRLSKGRFKWWPNKNGEIEIRLLVHELQLLMWNGNPQSAQTAPFWKKIPS